MKLFITKDPTYVASSAAYVVHEQHELAFVLEDTDSNPVVVIFADHCLRYQLDVILHAAADQVTNAVHEYDQSLRD